MTWALILHGGAKEIAPAQEKANRFGCLRALAAGQAVLQKGGLALEAVEASIRILEADPVFNAGFGSALNSEGEVQMDAALMDGATLDIGAVAYVSGVRHPISVARLLLREEPTLLAGGGARLFAARRGAELCELIDMVVARQKDSEASYRHDTVGCIALDLLGNFAVGTSTGGIESTIPGRIGDSPLPGCGFYADNELGAVAFSGEGENISRMILAARVMQALQSKEPQLAAEDALTRLHRIGGEAGCIILDRRGTIGWAHNSSHFAVAWMTHDMAEPRVALGMKECR